MYKKLLLMAMSGCSLLYAVDEKDKRKPVLRPQERSVIIEEKANTYSIKLYGASYGKELFMHGSAYLDSISYTKMNVLGDVAIKNSMVSDDAKIMGELAAHKTTFGGTVKVQGPVAASSSKFKKSLFVVGNVLLINSQAQDLIIEPKSPNDIVNVYLEGWTSVTGNITFKGGNCTVFVSRGARFNGDIVNGKIYRQ